MHIHQTFRGLQLPDYISQNWDITNWLCLKTKHIIFQAKQKQSGEENVFQIIAPADYPIPLWKRLSHIQSKYLLLPDNQRKIKTGYLLSYPTVTPLTKIIQKEGLSLSVILQIILDISKALETLHHASILHMDVSPNNIYLSEYGNFILGDFSESIPTKNNSSRKYHFAPKYACQKKEYFGTPGYSAPECIHGNPVEASDQYSLAMLCYVLCNNGLLPDHDSPVPEPAILQTDPDIGQEIFLAIRKSLAPEPSMRYKSISDFHNTIESIMQHITDRNSYYLQISDKSHRFFQLTTEQMMRQTPTKVSTGFFRFFYIPLVIFILLLVIQIPKHHTKPPDSLLIHDSVPTVTPVSEQNPTPTVKSPSNTELDLAGQDLSSLNDIMAKCSKISEIKTIYGENNQLEQLQELELFPSLRELYLSNNQIQNADNFRGLEHLYLLILSDNVCKDISGLSELQELNFLDLSGNHELSDIRPLTSCRNLKTLILSDTAVTESSIEQLQMVLPQCNIIY